MKHIKKTFLVVCGTILFILGSVGLLIPVFPTLPFLLIGTECLMKGSPKFFNWFKEKEIYKKEIKTFVEHKSITGKQKVVLSIGFIMIIVCSFIFHEHGISKAIILMFSLGCLYYFLFKVKTITKEEALEMGAEE